MKKYEPAITVVFLTLLFATLAFLVTRAVMRQHDLLAPRMECKSIEPNEPEFDSTLWVDCNDVNTVWGDDVAGYYSIEIDPNMVTEISYSEGVSFYIGNFEEWADFEIVRDGVVGCNISQAEFTERFPEFLYSFMGRVDPNTQYIIEWKEGEPK